MKSGSFAELATRTPKRLRRAIRPEPERCEAPLDCGSECNEATAFPNPSKLLPFPASHSFACHRPITQPTHKQELNLEI